MPLTTSPRSCLSLAEEARRREHEAANSLSSGGSTSPSRMNSWPRHGAARCRSTPSSMDALGTPGSVAEAGSPFLPQPPTPMLPPSVMGRTPASYHSYGDPAAPLYQTPPAVSSAGRPHSLGDSIIPPSSQSHRRRATGASDWLGLCALASLVIYVLCQLLAPLDYGGVEHSKSGASYREAEAQWRLSCVDNDQHCPMWARQRQCTLNYEFMLKMCSKSCGLCDRGSMGRFGSSKALAAAHRAARAKMGTVLCKDKHEHCADWSTKGECETNTFLLHECPVSCGECTPL